MLRALVLSLLTFVGLVTSLVARSLGADIDNRGRFEARTFAAGDYKLLYRLLKPKDYEPAKKYPMVIFLHGAGERGDDNQKQLVHGMNDFASDEVMSKYPAFVLAPQCPPDEAWGGINRLAKKATPPGELAPALDATLKAAAALQKEFSIDDHRIYITGLSMGGYGAWSALANRPELFAAAAPICGGGDSAAVAKFKSVPLWVFHGADDKTVPVERSREMVAALQAAGASPKYTEYPGVGHNSWSPTYSNPELYEWLFAQRRP
jgi:predicted peptidase